MWNLKNQKLTNTIMSDDPDFMKLLKDVASELREVKLELMRLRNETRERGISTKFLKMREACDYLHISRATMQKRISSGEITFASKNGGSYLFPEEKLKAYASGMA